MRAQKHTREVRTGTLENCGSLTFCNPPDHIASFICKLTDIRELPLWIWKKPVSAAQRVPLTNDTWLCCSAEQSETEWISESSLLTILRRERQQTFNRTTQTSSLPFFLSSRIPIHKTSTVLQLDFNYSHFDSVHFPHDFLPQAPYLMLCVCNMSGSVVLSEATKLPTGMFSILVTVKGSGKKTGPSLMSRTVTWTVAVELGP